MLHYGHLSRHRVHLATGAPGCTTTHQTAPDQFHCSVSCFPASATARTLDRGVVSMEELRAGDLVLSVDWDGSLTYKVATAV